MGFFDARRVTLAALALLVAGSAFGCSGNGVTDGATGQSEDEAQHERQGRLRLLRRQRADEFPGGRHRRQPRSRVGRRSDRRAEPAARVAASRSGRSAADGTPTRTTTPSPYAGQQGHSVCRSQLQLDFIWYELTTFSATGSRRSRRRAQRHRRDHRVPERLRGLRTLRAGDAHRLRRRRSSPRTARRPPMPRSS